MSSLTSSSAAAASAVWPCLPALKRSIMTAVSSGANAASWKSKFTARAIGQDTA